MLQRVYVQSHNVFVEPLDLGALAEMAVFYRDVDLVGLLHGQVTP